FASSAREISSSRLSPRARTATVSARPQSRWLKMPREQRLVRFAAPLALLALALPALGQTPQSRAELLRQQRAEKAKSVTPYEPRRLEKELTIVEDKAVGLVGREGFYPKLGSLTTGSGFAFGVG